MWTIQEFSKMTNLSPTTLRYYDKSGLLPSERNRNGYRIYSEQNLIIVKSIIVLKYVGLSLEDIKNLTSLFSQEQGDYCENLAKMQIADMKNQLGIWKEITEAIENVQTLFDTHQINKVNREELEALVDPIFYQISSRKV